MAYFERTGIKDTTGQQINPAQEEGITLLRAIFKLLKPLGFITGSGSNRLNLDVNAVTTLPSLSANTLGAVTSLGTVTTVTTVSTVTTCNTVASVTNLANIGGVNTFDLMKAMSRTAYNSGIRSNIN